MHLRHLTLLEQEGGIWDNPEELFRNSESTTSTPTLLVQEYKNKSFFFPPTTNPRVKIFLDFILNDIENMKIKNRGRNLTQGQLKAFETLPKAVTLLSCMRPNIKICVKRFLITKIGTVKLTSPMFHCFKGNMRYLWIWPILTTWFHQRHKIFLKSNFRSLQLFMLYRKCTNVRLIDPLGRPIISGIDSLTHIASKLINDFLRPHVEALPYFLTLYTFLPFCIMYMWQRTPS